LRTYTDTYGNGSGKPVGDAHGHANANAYTDGDSNSYVHTDAVCYVHTDAYTHTEGYTNRAASSDPTPASVGRSAKLQLLRRELARQTSRVPAELRLFQACQGRNTGLHL
jgi:hypothetical protein